MAHQKLGLDLMYGVERDADDDQDRRAAEIEAPDLHDGGHEVGNQGDDRQKDGPAQRDALHHLRDVVRRGLTGPDAQDEPAVLLHVVGDVRWVEDDRRVEVGEEYDQRDIADDVEQAVRLKKSLKESSNGALAEEIRHRVGEDQDGRGEDDGDDPGLIDPQRDERALAAVHLVAHHALGVLDRQTPLPLLEHDASRDDDDHEDEPDQERQQVQLPHADHAPAPHHRLGDPGHDAREDQEGDAVADAVIRQLLAHPHHGDGTRRERRHDQKRAEEAARENPLASQPRRHTHALHHGEEHGTVARPLDDLLAPLGIVLLELLQVGKDDDQELHDDARVDVGSDPEGEDAEILQGSAGEEVQEIQNPAVVAAEELSHRRPIDARRGDMGPEPEDEQDAEGEQDPSFKVGQSEGVAERPEHVRSPRPSRLPPRSSHVPRR